MKGLLKGLLSFIKLTGKKCVGFSHLIKLPAADIQFYWKKAPTQMLCFEFCKNFWNGLVKDKLQPTNIVFQNLSFHENFGITDLFHQREISCTKAVARRYSMKNVFIKIHRKKPVPESLFK